MSLQVVDRQVVFDGETIAGVFSFRVERRSESFISGAGDGGPLALFADAPGVATTIIIEHDDLVDARVLELMPGRSGSLVCDLSIGNTDAGRMSLTALAVLTGNIVKVDVKGGARRELRFSAISADGMSDPVILTEAFD